MIGIYPKKKGETIFYVNSLNYRFSLPKLDSKGKKQFKTHPHTGNQKFDPSTGDPIVLEYPIEFKPWKTRFSEDGYWSVFVVTKETPKQIVDELKKDSANRGSKIMTEQAFLAQTNPDLAARIKQDNAKDAVIEQQDSELKALREKLSNIGGNKVSEQK